MRDHTLYWLREVRDWDNPPLPQDRGMAWGHLPVTTAAGLLKRRLVKKAENGRIVLTRAGREIIGKSVDSRVVSG